MSARSWPPCLTLLFLIPSVFAALQTTPPSMPEFGVVPSQTSQYYAAVTSFKAAFNEQPDIQSLESRWSNYLDPTIAALFAQFPYVPTAFPGQTVPSDPADYLTQGVPPPWVTVLPSPFQEKIKAAQTEFAEGMRSVIEENLGEWPEGKKDVKHSATSAEPATTESAPTSKTKSHNAAATPAPPQLKAALAAAGALGAAVAMI